MAEEPIAEDAQPRETRRRRGQPLSAGRIAETALDLIDREGLEAFSFRVLASRLGCQAMSIYHYFPSKQHLFEALVDIVLAEAAVPDPSGTWQEQLLGVVETYRKAALRHPGFFFYLAIFRMNNRTGLTFLEGVLRVFEKTGLPPELRARHFRAMSYYLVGACIDETQGYAKGPSAITPVPDEEARRDFPAIMSVGPWFSPAHHEATFRAGVQVLIRGIEADIQASTLRPIGQVTPVPPTPQ